MKGKKLFKILVKIVLSITALITAIIVLPVAVHMAAFHFADTSLIANLKQPPISGADAEQFLLCPRDALPLINCVSSEENDPVFRVEPIPYNGTKEEMIKRIKAYLSENGKNIIAKETESYLHVEAYTELFGYCDDVELRFDDSKKTVAIRSASRLGRSDFGVNRHRAETYRAVFSR